MMHKFLIHKRDDHVGVAPKDIGAHERGVGVYMDLESTWMMTQQLRYTPNTPFYWDIKLQSRMFSPVALFWNMAFRSVKHPLASKLVTMYTHII